MNAAANQPGQAMRPKHWDEMNDAEKISALHETVCWQHQIIQRMARELHDYRDHKHLGDEILVPLHNRNREHEGLRREDIPFRLMTTQQATQR